MMVVAGGILRFSMVLEIMLCFVALGSRFTVILSKDFCFFFFSFEGILLIMFRNFYACLLIFKLHSVKRGLWFRFLVVLVAKFVKLKFNWTQSDERKLK